ncbi:AAA family ATPase, partial [Solirubrobacter phytolaccae]
MRLLERENELRQLHALLDAARRGEGGTILVEAAAGAGKTALLNAARDQPDFRTLHATGGELEREFPFGVVRQLFERTVHERRDELLVGAAAQAAPAIGAGTVEPVADASFATLHGLYWLTAGLAETAPLLLVVDDAHWSDAPSLRFLDFLARRVPELPVAILVGARPNEPGAEQDLLHALDATVLRPRALTAPAVKALLGEDVPEDAVGAALTSTRGNPLLVRELLRSLDGTPITADAVNAAVPSSITRSVERRLARVPEPARRLARALAVLGDRRDLDLLATAAELTTPEAVAALVTLKELELADDDPPRFIHPLVAAAVAEPVTTRDRAQLHRRAAEHLRHRPGAEEDVVVHLLAAPPLHQPWAAQALRDGAARALDEGAPDAAVRRLHRALEEDDGGARFELELELGRAAVRAGDPQAADRLRFAATAPDPELSARAIEELIATGGNRLHEPLEPIADALQGALERLGPAGDPVLRDRLAAHLLNAVILDPRMAARRAALLDRWLADPGPGVLAHLVYQSACTAVPADQVRRMAVPIFSARPFAQLTGIEHPSPFWGLVGLLAVDDAGTTDAALRDAEATVARSRTRLGSAFVSFMRAEWELAFGSAARAEAQARNALELQGFAFQTATEIGVRGAVIRSLVLSGQLAEADTIAAGFPADLDGSWGGLIAWTARSELRMAQGRPHDALADLDRMLWLLDAYEQRRFPLGYPTALRARALIAVGRADEGRELAERELAESRDRGVASAEAMALLALAGALAPGEDVAVLRAAVAVAEGDERA